MARKKGVEIINEEECSKIERDLVDRYRLVSEFRGGKKPKEVVEIIQEKIDKIKKILEVEKIKTASKDGLKIESIKKHETKEKIPVYYLEIPCVFVREIGSGERGLGGMIIHSYHYIKVWGTQKDVTIDLYLYKSRSADEIERMGNIFVILKKKLLNDGFVKVKLSKSNIKSQLLIFK